MTEDKAREKICPFVTKGNVGCKGRRCMMWEWDLEIDIPKKWRRPAILNYSKTDGHCGLMK